MKNAVDVHNYLVERDVPHEMVATGGRVRTPDQVAGALGLEPDQVGRVVLFEGPQGLVGAVVPAADSPDPRKVSEAVGHEVQEVSPERATELTEYLNEALPPVALPPGTTLVLDRRVDSEEVTYFPGGDPTSVLKIRPPDLLRATDARIADLAG